MINYSLLVQAEKFFSAAGFVRIEVPWAVSGSAIRITAPERAQLYPFEETSYLVASGEQSLLESCIKQHLKGSFLAITPCFRHENEVSDLIRPYFMKLELFDNINTTNTRLEEIISLCEDWFSKHIACRVIETDQSQTDPTVISNSYDIVSSKKETELGSYGIRQHPLIGEWVYATGCAEPRLSTAIRLEQQ